MQRSRLLVAVVGAVAELGWEDASIARITERAGVSRRTFYELFDNREQCLVELLEGVVAQITAEMVAAGMEGCSWCERVRGGLWTILCFFDREPELARVCMVESRRSSGIALAYRERIVDRLTEIVVEGGEDHAGNGTAGYGGEIGALTAHCVVGGVSEVLYSQLSSDSREPLRGLLGQLMGMIVLPYLGVKAARRELSRPAPADLSSDTLANDTPALASSAAGGSDVLAELPMRLTYRTAKVLQVLAEHPAQSNRGVANLVGIADQGQISKLLARLARLGLVVNDGSSKGERNSWTLTATGEQVTRSIQSYTQTTNGHQIAR